jgi:hypothetical protein
MSNTIWRFILILGFSPGLGATPVMAVSTDLSYVFNQDGYSSGATVSGAFSGIDLDGNGILVHFPLRGQGEPPIEHLELTSWSMHFSGNSLSPAFDLTLSDLFGFVYEIGTSGLGDDPAFDPTINQNLIEGIGAIGAAHFYSSGLGPNSFIGGYVGGQIDFEELINLEDHALDSSPNLVVVTLVPEPSGIGLLISASLLLAQVGRNTPRHLASCANRG